jgi:phosphoribosylformylglycinamidine synthase
VAEAARNVACTGAEPVAATNCLNFGSPERPEIMGQFRDVVAGLGEACEALGTPITGGNVSFYNQTGDVAVHPTPVVGVLGVLDDATRHVGNAFVSAGDLVCVLGAAARPGLGGSEYLWRVHGRVAGRPPAVDLDEERALHALLVEAARRSLLRSAHDVADGGLLVTLVESCLRAELGADVTPGGALPPVQVLFGESPTRVVASVAPGAAADLERLCDDLGVGCRRLGTVTAEPVVRFDGLLDLDLEDARTAYSTGLTAALGER